MCSSAGLGLSVGAFAESIFGDFIGRNALCSACFTNARTLFCLLTADHGAERHVSGLGRHFRSTLTRSGRLLFAAESFHLKESSTVLNVKL